MSFAWIHPLYRAKDLNILFRRDWMDATSGFGVVRGKYSFSGNWLTPCACVLGQRPEGRLMGVWYPSTL